MMSRRVLLSTKITFSSFGVALLLGGAASGCSSAPIKNKEPDHPAPAAKTPSEVEQLKTRLEAMEEKITTLQGKLNSAQQALENVTANTTPPRQAVVIPHGAERGGVGFTAPSSAHDPDAGYANDAAIQAYRKAILLFHATRYSDAILNFSTFLEKYPDHPLAGTAQFYVGESYLKQNEYRLAVQEFQRVLTSYDRSPHIAQTLHEMADAEDHLKQTESAARHRQLLMSLFPHSPFAMQTTEAIHTQSANEGTEAKSENESVSEPAIEPQSPPKNAAPKGHSKPSAGKLDEPPPTVPLEAPKEDAPKEDALPANEPETPIEN